MSFALTVTGKIPRSASSRQATRAFMLAWLILTPFVLLACDPDGKRQCAWVLEPEPKLIGTTAAGFIPVCARNRTTMKEDCRLQATLDYAKGAYGRKFRYVDMDLKSHGTSRTVDAIEFCDAKKP